MENAGGDARCCSMIVAVDRYSHHGGAAEAGNAWAQPRGQGR